MCQKIACVKRAAFNVTNYWQRHHDMKLFIIVIYLYFIEAKALAEKQLADAKALAGDKCSIQ